MCFSQFTCFVACQLLLDAVNCCIFSLIRMSDSDGEFEVEEFVCDLDDAFDDIEYNVKDSFESNESDDPFAKDFVPLMREPKRCDSFLSRSLRIGSSPMLLI